MMIKDILNEFVHPINVWKPLIKADDATIEKPYKNFSTPVGIVGKLLGRTAYLIAYSTIVIVAIPLLATNPAGAAIGFVSAAATIKATSLLGLSLSVVSTSISSAIFATSMQHLTI